MALSEQKAKIAAAFNGSMVGMEDAVTPIMLALVLRQIMPSLAIAQVDEMVTAHMLEKGRDNETTFSEFLEWLFSEDHMKLVKPLAEAKAAKEAKAQAPPPPPADAEQMPEEAAKSWKIFQDLLKTRPYLADPSTGHPLCSFVTLCSQSFAEKKYEETAILVERINNTIIEDEKRIAAAFKHFDKDSSGVLERQEFKFLCAYLGWSAEESNSIDVNKDGTVSLAELQNFVGFLGGVQKFFEQRRKRVTESRKDVKEVCPVVGVEVGARVRSHFYYKNGQKSSSWREAQVLSVNCHTDSGRGILLEFGFEDLKGNSDWVARQVVPISWILSSHEETSLAAALREVGILDDSQALYKMLLPMSELQSIQGLVSCQRAALALVRQQATLSHENALEDLKGRFEGMGYGDYELQAVFSWVKDLAPLVIHVHLDNMGQFLETDEYYRNQFETKTSCGAIDDGNETRKGWEQALFGDSYESAKPFDRCKYGALNVTNDYRGVTSAMQYGDSYLVLKDVRLRATFCATDSGGIQGSRLGVCDRYAHVLAEYNDSELQEITRVAMAALPHIENGAPSGNVPKSAWPQVLRAYSEDCSQEWITVGYPKLAKRDTGRFVYEVEFYEHVETPQVGLLSELYEKRLGVMSPTGVGDDAHGWALDPQHAEIWSNGQSKGWEGCRMASCDGGKQFVGVAVDLAAKKLWFGVNGLWSEKPSFSNLPDGIALYPALSFKGRASFVFQELKHPPPASLGEFSAWPQTFQGKFRIDCPKVGSSDVLDVYKEFQVHGEVCLKKHVCRLVANNKYRETPKFERSRNVELSKGGPFNGTYEKVGIYNNAPLYHCDEAGWIFYDRPSSRWRLNKDTGEHASAHEGDLVTAQRNNGARQAGVITKVLGGDRYEITWTDGEDLDRIKSKDDLSVIDCAKNFKDDGTFALEAPADPFLQDTAPPVQGWMASPESSGYVELEAFKKGMKDLGVDVEGAALKQWTDQLLQKTGRGQEVMMRRPSVDVSFDKILQTVGCSEDAPTAWRKIGEAAQQLYLSSKGFGEGCHLIQTPHPYKAERHSWTKDIAFPDAKGCKFIFSKRCKTFDSCAKLMIKTGGIPKSSIGPGMRIEVEGKNGERRFGSVVEVDSKKGGKLVKLDMEIQSDYHAGDQVEVDGKPGTVLKIKRGPQYVIQAEDGSEATYLPEKVKLVSRRIPTCPNCGTAMLWGENVEGGYGWSNWSCDECDRTADDGQKTRWNCKDCCTDYCKNCYPHYDEADEADKDPKAPRPAEEFAFCVDEFQKTRVQYSNDKPPGDEIEGFVLDLSHAMSPVAIKSFKTTAYPAQEEGVKDWWHVDVVQTLMEWNQGLFEALGGEATGAWTTGPSEAEEVLKDLEGAVKTLNAALAKKDWDDEDPWFYFTNGFSHRLVPEAHITYTGRVGDEIKAFEARGDWNNPKIEDMELGLAHAAGVRRGWVLSVEDTLSEEIWEDRERRSGRKTSQGILPLFGLGNKNGWRKMQMYADENSGIIPEMTQEDAASEEMRLNPEKLLEMSGITLVFECEDALKTLQTFFFGFVVRELDRQPTVGAGSWGEVKEGEVLLRSEEVARLHEEPS
ncbi:Hypothetical protein (Fragment) [Durusdinium trenchii]|uniref:Calmodulin n=1 Tax=Durusdinium trenchii TaxID=1381693 RepID=A0ABP0I321_9DINO